MTILKRAGKWIGITIVSILVIGTLLEQGIQFYLNAAQPDSRTFCDNNGKLVHYVKKGSGGPTVVFQSGLGSDYKIWQAVQDSLSQFTTTISYDRAGLLWSEASDSTKTLQHITFELTQLLEKTSCPKPYILAGHSLAGITLRPFINRASADVAGVVFVDVAHPLQLKQASEALKKYVAVPPEWLIAFVVETGIFRAVFTIKPFVSDLPADHWYNRHVRDYFYRSYRTVLEEAREDDVMFEEADMINTFGDIPLSIITAAYPNGVDFTADPELQQEYLSLHQRNQKDLLKLSSRSAQCMAAHSSHYIPLQEPDRIVHEIKKMMTTE